MRTETLPALLAVEDLPSDVMDPIRTLGGYFLFLLNTFAVIHLLFLAAAIPYEKIKDRPMADLGSGEWFTKIIIGLWVATIAGDVAAAALVMT